ncbi:MAG: type II toxin-antitoxin system VapC family toxin [Bacteroidetes bacterium]|nr:type II toxin-antitoxin system VapC family toxin [Bacteroidota bacterium]
MNGNVLLDTNIIIRLWANDPVIIKNIAEVKRVFVPSTVFGELYYGAFHSKNIESNLNRIVEFSKKVGILSADFNTAFFYGEIKANLKSKGTPIPENDIWIAALAKQYKITLITRDTHFNFISDIDIQNWSE